MSRHITVGPRPIKRLRSWPSGSFLPLLLLLIPEAHAQNFTPQVGREVAVPAHLQDGEEFTTPIPWLIQYGEKLFNAKFTIQEGAGRPLSKGTGAPLSDPSSPLLFPRNFDRISSPEANACSGCHNAPVSGAGGDRVTEVFVLAQRFDHLSFDHSDGISLRGAVDEAGKFVTLDNATDDRKTVGMNGSGFVEMLARQMTADLQAERDATPPGTTRSLVSKGIFFGTLVHNADGTWSTSQVQGLAAPSLSVNGALPSLIIRPLHQVGNVISLRQFTNNAFNHHHGMQSEERFGLNTDPDGDGFTNELTVADLTAVSIFQATLPVPGRVVPNDPAVERANVAGEALFNNWLRHLPRHLAADSRLQSWPAGPTGLDLLRAEPLQSRDGSQLTQLAPWPSKLSSHRSTPQRRLDQRLPSAAASQASRRRCHGSRLHRPKAPRH